MTAAACRWCGNARGECECRARAMASSIPRDYAGRTPADLYPPTHERVPPRSLTRLEEITLTAARFRLLAPGISFAQSIRYARIEILLHDTRVTVPRVR